MVSTSSPKSAAPETEIDVAPGELPIEAFKSRSPVMVMTSSGRLAPPTIPLKIRSADVPPPLPSKLTVRSRGVSAASLRSVLPKVMLPSSSRSIPP